jgi:hypothetical protein
MAVTYRRLTDMGKSLHPLWHSFLLKSDEDWYQTKTIFQTLQGLTEHGAESTVPVNGDHRVSG